MHAVQHLPALNVHARSTHQQGKSSSIEDLILPIGHVTDRVDHLQVVPDVRFHFVRCLNYEDRNSPEVLQFGWYFVVFAIPHVDGAQFDV